MENVEARDVIIGARRLEARRPRRLVGQFLRQPVRVVYVFHAFGDAGGVYGDRPIKAPS